MWLVGMLGACGADQPCDPDAPDTICTVAGGGGAVAGQGGYSGDGGPATAAALYLPMATAISPTGELWVLDSANYVVRSIDASGEIRTVVGKGQIGDSPVSDGVPSVPALDATLNLLTDLSFHDGYAYLAGFYNSDIKRVRLAGMTIEEFAGDGQRTHYDGDGGPAATASFETPSSIAFDPAGELAIMDQGNEVIRSVDGDNVIHTIAGQCVVVNDETGSMLSECPATAPLTACAGSEKLTCGAPDQCADSCAEGLGGDGGPAVAARMAQPSYGETDPTGRIIYDAVGELIFADTDNHQIRRIDAGGVIETIAGTGIAGASGDGGPATQAQLGRPVGLAAAPDGTLYFSDVSANCVRMVSPAGIISTVAGRCELHDATFPGGGAFDGDGGPPELAMLNAPYGLTLSGAKLYVSDTYNHRIRVVNLP